MLYKQHSDRRYTSEVFVPSIIGAAEGGQRQSDPDDRPQRPTNSESIAHRCYSVFDDLRRASLS